MTYYVLQGIRSELSTVCLQFERRALYNMQYVLYCGLFSPQSTVNGSVSGGVTGWRLPGGPADCDGQI